MSRRKQNPPVSAGDSQGRGGPVNDLFWDYDSTNVRCLSRPRLNPQDGALLKLDSVEMKLQAARAIGDDTLWVRYYQAWLKLHALAFGYGRWAGGAGR